MVTGSLIYGTRGGSSLVSWWGYRGNGYQMFLAIQKISPYRLDSLLLGTTWVWYTAHICIKWPLFSYDIFQHCQTALYVLLWSPDLRNMIGWKSDDPIIEKYNWSEMHVSKWPNSVGQKWNDLINLIGRRSPDLILKNLIGYKCRSPDPPSYLAVVNSCIWGQCVCVHEQSQLTYDYMLSGFQHKKRKSGSLHTHNANIQRNTHTPCKEPAHIR